MDNEPSTNLLRGLASFDRTTRLDAVCAVMARTADLPRDEDSNQPGMMVQFFEEQWRSAGPDREDIVRGLALVMADPATSLLDVNLITYALAAAGEDGIPELLDLLAHYDFSVQLYAAMGLATLDSRARWVVPALCRALERSYRGYTWYVILGALGSIGGERATDMLQAFAADALSRDPVNEDYLREVEKALAAAMTQD